MTHIKISTPESIEERIPVREADLFTGENQFNVLEVSNPADIQKAEDAFANHMTSPSGGSHESIVSNSTAPSVSPERKPLAITRRGRVAAGVAALVTAVGIMTAANITPTHEPQDKIEYQKDINKRAGR